MNECVSESIRSPHGPCRLGGSPVGPPPGRSPAPAPAPVRGVSRGPRSSCNWDTPSRAGRGARRLLPLGSRRLRPLPPALCLPAPGLPATRPRTPLPGNPRRPRGRDAERIRLPGRGPDRPGRRGRGGRWRSSARARARSLTLSHTHHSHTLTHTRTRTHTRSILPSGLQVQPRPRSCFLQTFLCPQTAPALLFSPAAGPSPPTLPPHPGMEHVEPARSPPRPG